MLLIEGLKDFCRDLINVKVLIFKLIYFFLLSAVVILWPQFTIHQQSLGLTVYQTGIVGSVFSVTVIFLPFLSGIIGDKVGNFKVLMSLITALAAVPALLLAWVPSAKVNSPPSNSTSNLTAANTTAATNISLTNAVPQEVDPEQLAVTFWLYLATRVVYGVFQGAGYTLFEAAVMANMQDSGINFGYQRAWGTVGVIFSSLLGGYIVELTGDFSIIFYVSSALQLLTGVLMMGVQMDFKASAQSLTKGIIKYLFNPEVILFFCSMLAAGMFIGYLETFMYRYLFALGATPVLIGLTVTVGAPFEVVFQLFTGYFVKLVGHVPLIILGLFCYAVRVFGFSLLVDPWWVLPLEIIECVANGVLFTAAIMYCTMLCPIEAIASFRGVFAAVYFGVGKLIGTLIGTEIRERLGDKTTFQVWAGVALACTIIYGLSYILMKRLGTKRFSVKPFHGSTGTQEEAEYKEGIDNKAWNSCE